MAIDEMAIVAFMTGLFALLLTLWSMARSVYLAKEQREKPMPYRLWLSELERRIAKLEEDNKTRRNRRDGVTT